MTRSRGVRASGGVGHLAVQALLYTTLGLLTLRCSATEITGGTDDEEESGGGEQTPSSSNGTNSNGTVAWGDGGHGGMRPGGYAGASGTSEVQGGSDAAGGTAPSREADEAGNGGSGSPSVEVPDEGGWEVVGGASATSSRCAQTGLRCLAGTEAVENGAENWESTSAEVPAKTVSARADLADVSSKLNGVNNREQLVGTSGCGHAILIEPTGEVVDLLANFTDSQSRAIDINDAGVIIGEVEGRRPSNGSTPTYPFVWSEGVTTVLTDYQGAQPITVNEEGQVLLAFSRGGGGLWRDGEFTELNADLFPASLNNDGVVVGQRRLPEEGRVGFRWWDGNRTDLTQLATAIAINDSGQILGQTSTSAAILDGDELRELPLLSSPIALAADGSVLGSNYVYVEDSLWSLTRNGNADGSGFDWFRAVAFNDHHLIVGEGATWVLTSRGRCANDECGYEKTFGVVWRQGCFGTCCGQANGDGGAGGSSALDPEG